MDLPVDDFSESEDETETTDSDSDIDDWVQQRSGGVQRRRSRRGRWVQQWESPGNNRISLILIIF